MSAPVYETAHHNTSPRQHFFSDTTPPALPPTVVAMGELTFTGNLIPHTWYHHLKLPSGHTDLVACTLLAELVYQYRPLAVRDETTGEVLYYVKRFARDQFCAPLAYFAHKFGLTVDQVRQGLKRLEQAGFIQREYRTLQVAGRQVPGMAFIDLDAERIRAITEPDSAAVADADLPGAIPGSAGQAPGAAVSVPQGAVSVPLYKDTPRSLQDSQPPPPPTPLTSVGFWRW